MLSVNKCVGNPFSHVRPSHKLYEAFDPVVFDGICPREDAASIAKDLLEIEKPLDVHGFVAKHGWTPRRANPALAIVGEFVADGRKHRPVGKPYCISALFVDPRERAVLRRFVKQLEKS